MLNIPTNIEPIKNVDADPRLLHTSSFIDGAFITPSRDPDLYVLNPYNDALVAAIHSVTPSEVEVALRSASDAFHQWRCTSNLERAAVLDRLYQLLEEHKEDLASIIVAENGKPRTEALAEVAYASSYVAQARSAALNATHSTRAGSLDGATLTLVLREPVGVVLAVTPWNFPLAMLVRKLSPALAAGCTVVAKPSELTPLSALALAEIAEKAGLPPGVFSVLVTSNSEEVCAQVLAHTDVRMVSFTGSTLVGRALSAAAAKRLLRTVMELGGLAPLIVCEDADLHSAVNGLMKNKFRNAGQSCVSINRAYVHANIVNEFLALVKARMQRDVVLGEGNKPHTTVGPLISKKAVQRVRAQIANAVKLGATVVFEGALPAAGDSGAFCPPTLLADVPDGAEVLQLETFGPVIAVQEFDDYRDVVRKANDTEMGLASYVYTKNLTLAHSIARSLQAGMVGVNSVAISDSRTCFGGVKQSGSGREGSEFCLEDFTELKHVLMEHGTVG